MGKWNKRKKHSKTYKSGLEEAHAEYFKSIGVDAPYETTKIKYFKPVSYHTYTPDFILPNNIIVETKGIFDASDRKKHLLIREQHPELDIRFVFSRSKSWLTKSKKGTYASWCEKNGFLYCDKLILEEWINE